MSEANRPPPHTPKVGLTGGSEPWYRYYAGYSTRFVEDCLTLLALPDDALVVDPWNGSGTTTFVAADRGFGSLGIDANPALFVVAKARLLGLETVPSLMPLIHEMTDRAAHDEWLGDASCDPLATWLAPCSVRAVRSLEKALQHLLVENKTYRPLNNPDAVEGLSSLACFYYVCLFEAVRHNVKRFGTTNPTWVKSPKSLAHRVRPSRESIHSTFQQIAERLQQQLGAGGQRTAFDSGQPQIGVHIGRSQEIPLNDGAADAVVTSPPYCTRIDYVVATLPELAVLGYEQERMRVLRDAMLGTPTIVASPASDAQTRWGATAESFLAAVKVHSSRASATYYYRCFSQYFGGLSDSLAEIARVLRPNAAAALVVQDSFYKEVHLDLAAVVAEMGAHGSLALDERFDFPVRTTKAAVNPGARRYRASFDATESAIVLRRQ